MGAGRTSFRVEVLGAAKDHTLARYSKPSFSDHAGAAQADPAAPAAHQPRGGGDVTGKFIAGD
jgi:hypothetical protein